MLLKPPLGSFPDLSHPLMQGMVGMQLFNEGCGELFRDTGLGANNNGVLSGADWIGGIAGTAVNFNGSSDTASIVMPSLFGLKTFSVVAMVRATDVSAAEEIVFEYSSDANYGGFYVNHRIANTVYMIESATGGTVTLWTTNSALTPGKWTQIAFTGNFNLTSNELVGYKDGIEDGILTTNGNNTGSLPSDTLYLGARNADSFYWNGAISYFFIFSRVLSALEIQSLHQNPFQMFSHNRVALWDLAAAGGPSFKTAWALNSNNLIGAH